MARLERAGCGRGDREQQRARHVHDPCGHVGAQRVAGEQGTHDRAGLEDAAVPRQRVLERVLAHKQRQQRSPAWRVEAADAAEPKQKREEDPDRRVVRCAECGEAQCAQRVGGPRRDQDPLAAVPVRSMAGGQRQHEHRQCAREPRVPEHQRIVRALPDLPQDGGREHLQRGRRAEERHGEDRVVGLAWGACEVGGDPAYGAQGSGAYRPHYRATHHARSAASDGCPTPVRRVPRP